MHANKNIGSIVLGVLVTEKTRVIKIFAASKTDRVSCCTNQTS